MLGRRHDFQFMGVGGVFHCFRQSFHHRAVGNQFVLHFWSKLFNNFFLIACSISCKLLFWLLRSNVIWFLPMSPASCSPSTSYSHLSVSGTHQTHLFLGLSICQFICWPDVGLADNFLFSNFQLPRHFLHEAILEHSI